MLSVNPRELLFAELKSRHSPLKKFFSPDFIAKLLDIFNPFLIIKTKNPRKPLILLGLRGFYFIHTRSWHSASASDRKERG